MRRPEESRAILSSLSLQIAIFFNGWFSLLFVLLSLALYVYKDVQYFYPKSGAAIEVSCVFLYALCETMRLFLASKGNKTEQINPLIASIVLAVPVIVAHVYFISLQTYVLRVDIIINAIGLVFVGIECLLGALAAMSFYSAFRG